VDVYTKKGRKRKRRVFIQRLNQYDIVVFSSVGYLHFCFILVFSGLCKQILCALNH
jgi:hypothetical protein